MGISRLLALGFGFLFVILLAEIGLNQYVSNQAYDRYIKLKTEVQPNVIMLNRFISVNREFSLLTTNYLSNGGIINRNRINKIMEVEFDFYISEIQSLKNLLEDDPNAGLLDDIEQTTSNLIRSGRLFTTTLVTKNDFNDPEKVAFCKEMLVSDLAVNQNKLNSMLEILQYQFNKELHKNQEQLAQDFSNASRVILVTGIVGIILGIILAYWILVPINTPVINLSEGAELVRAGNYSTVVTPVGNNELTKLTHTFNQMVADLKTSFSKVEDANTELQSESAKLKLTLESSKTGMWEWDIQTNELVWDEQMKLLYGVDNDSFTGAYDAWSEGLHPEDKERCETELQDAVKGVAPFKTGFRIVWPSGEVRYIGATGLVIPDENGKPTKMVGLNWDVTEAKEAEHAINSYSRLLERRNRELNEFTYIASHDLQEPINTMTAFSSLVLSKYGDVLDDTAKEYLGYVMDSGARGKTLISDLLDYSKLGRETVLGSVKLSSLIDEALADLKGTISEKDADVTVEVPATLKANVYGTELRLLFQNLISNALKFCPTDRKPKIHIQGKAKNDVLEFSITDNGIGISQENQKKIFAVFARLNLKSEYEGTGIGLAHCKKIVDMHEGEIWVESELDNGSSFKFTISKELL